MAEHTYAPVDGEIVDQVDISALAVLNEGEINQQIATAKKYPRSVKKFQDEALNLATLDEQTAGECIYALPRDGKVIEGPSARLAEIIDYAWGNTRSLSRVVAEDAEFVTSQGIYFDLERNRAVSCEVKRRITNRSGNRYSADMIVVTSNAAASIAYRNCVFRGVPKALWKPIYDRCRRVVAGDFKTLVNRRETALQAFVIYGVTPDMIYKTLGVGGKEDIGMEQLVILNGFLTSMKDGDASVEDIFGNIEPLKKSAQAGAATQQTAEAISEKYKSGNGNKNGDKQPEPPPLPKPPEYEGPFELSARIKVDVAVKEMAAHAEKMGRPTKAVLRGIQFTMLPPTSDENKKLNELAAKELAAKDAEAKQPKTSGEPVEF